ncbi:MAG: SNF2-related protein [Patescibacteria group bacterium]|nr:SNF2-related protein [Patescibacteria group bacterium]
MPPNERWFGLNPFNPEEAFKDSITSDERDESEHGGPSEPLRETDPKVQKIVEELRVAHAKWKALSEAGGPEFNSVWLQQNDASLLKRMYHLGTKKGGISYCISLAGGVVKEDFKKIQIRDRTPETTIFELRAAHAKWKALPQEKRGKFNIYWLQKNVSAVTRWMRSHGGFDLFIKLAGGEVAEDFEKTERVYNRTVESVIAELRAAHAIWKAQQKEDDQKVFNRNWLEDNDYKSLIRWMEKRDGYDAYIKLAGGDVERDFKIERARDRTSEMAIKELRAAHAIWKALPETKREAFSPQWLIENLSGLTVWMRSNGGIERFIKLAGGDVERDFKKIEQVRDRTFEMAIKELRAAHAIWKAQQKEDDQKVFNYNWLVNNGYYGLIRWMEKRDGYDAYIKLAGGDVERDFKKIEQVRDRTFEMAIKELRAAHAIWKALPEKERGWFNTKWLTNNFSGLTVWMRSNGGIERFIKLAGGDVEKDFEKVERVRDRTFEMAIKELRAAHAIWKAQQKEDDQKVFNPDWLGNNGYYGLVGWMRRNGGYERYIKSAGSDIEKDFEKKGVSRYERLREHLEAFFKEVGEGETDISKYFRSLLNAFGASHCIDILYKFRPEYRAIHPEDVKGTIAEYLGDYLVAKRPFTADDAENAIEHLSDLSLREGLTQTLKEDCHRFVTGALRHRNGRDSKALVDAYREHVREKIGHLAHPIFAEIVEEVIGYYQDLWVSYNRPDNVVASLSEQREFPDINQRLNMKELAEKKRLLIADEMGLGKSASAILAKERLGLKCALVVAPSNVVDTWRRYLSGESEGGYFQQGQAPKVCVLDDPKQLSALQAGAYDYVLLSHERLDPRYVSEIKKLEPDMLIVDEMHKLKELKGKRSQQLLELSEDMGDDKYVALLSGTPVPNKIEDIAVTLKVLYPEKFKNKSDRDLVFSIIYGDLVDLRALLIPRMQMKSLEESLEMPELHEEVRKVELSDLEKEVYEILLEDDELLATEKIRILRQFLLNPHLVDSTPGITGCKVEAISEELNTAFSENNKVVVFVNDYIESVIRGRGNILEGLHLPAEVDVKIIHGEVPKQERIGIEDALKEPDRKVLLVVSGQTADVGVDYSSADRVFFYNEPWTEYQKRQELGRVYRPGLAHDLKSDTFIAKGTIEEGMHQYIERKYLAVEKLLRGIPITDLERNLLRQDEKNDEPDLSVNPELAEYYFSSWDKLNKIFGYVKDIGEQDFRRFLEKYGGDYADAYRVLGNRSYQSNANRVTATVIDKMVKSSGKEPASLRILDVASGPEMLKRHLGEAYQEQVTSMDMNAEHFKGSSGKNDVVGSWLDMPFPDKTFDYLNQCLSLHYTNFVPSKGKYERLQVFQEMNRVLKVGGRVVLNLIYSYPLKHPQAFREALQELGFSVVEDYTGDATFKDRYQSHLITLEKVKDLDPDVSAEELSDLMGKEKRDGLKFVESKEKLRKSRQVITKFSLQGREMDLALNDKDQEVLAEEQDFFAEAEALKKKHGSIRRIPASEIIEHGFVRVLSGSKYVLFKKLEKGSGAVVIRE